MTEIHPLDEAWEAINAQGGASTGTAWSNGYCDGIGKALEIIEKLGGMNPVWRGKIITAAICPPIPIRDFDWCAHIKGREEEGQYGWGATEQEAIKALLRLLD